MTSRETTLLRSYPKLIKTLNITKMQLSVTAGMLVGPGHASNGLDNGTGSIFCTNGQFPTGSGSYVRIFLAVIWEPVLAVRAGHVVGGYKGGKISINPARVKKTSRPARSFGAVSRGGTHELLPRYSVRWFFLRFWRFFLLRMGMP